MVEALPKVESPVTESVPAVERFAGVKFPAVRLVKLAKVANKEVEVAAVDEAKVVVRFVIVEDAEFERIEPTVNAPAMVEVSEEVALKEPMLRYPDEEEAN